MNSLFSRLKTALIGADNADGYNAYECTWFKPYIYDGCKDPIFNIKQADSYVVLKLTSIPFLKTVQIMIKLHSLDIFSLLQIFVSI